LPTLLQYYCTAIGQYMTPHPTLLVYAIHHTIWAMAISCKGQPTPPSCFAGRYVDLPEDQRFLDEYQRIIASFTPWYYCLCVVLFLDSTAPRVKG